MDNLQLPHAKLLYFVAELWKRGDITDSEKTLLKGMRKQSENNCY
jgi:hypothetical protein